MISIRNYFLVVFLVATIICQFGVKAPRRPANRHRGEQNPVAHQHQGQNPNLVQQLDAVTNYIQYLQNQVNTLSTQIGNAHPTLLNLQTQGIFNYSY
uniref:Uncharacterized protein n=1 Tax=Meloidogyne floridensis TaxID=298350 RepID=A0A915NAE7_9BILA